MVKDFSRGKVYKIECRKTGKVYVGSTVEKYLSKRLSKHVSNRKDYLNGTKTASYTTSYEVIEGGDYFISLLEACPCSCFEELRAREQHYIDITDCVNKRPAYRSEEEKREYKHQHYLKNKEQYNASGKERYEENKEEHIAVSRKWYEEHKEEVLERNKQRYEENKEEILAKQREYNATHRHVRKARDDRNREQVRKYANTKVKCECGVEVSRSNLAAHRRSKNHVAK